MILKNRVDTPYPWIEIKTPVDHLLYLLSLAEEEEDAELDSFALYLNDIPDRGYFSAEEKRKIRQLLTVLIEDTREHGKMLREAVEQLSDFQKGKKTV